MAIRRKRGDTKVGTIEKKYGVKFGVRGDMRLDTLLRRTGASSLSKVVKLAKRGHLEPWRSAERAACRRRGLPHVGGSGAPDCDGGEHVVEVKEQRRQVSERQVREVAAKPWAQGKRLEMVSSSGFTRGAVSAARSLGVVLRKK